jgi:hypothetical protein
LGCCGSRATANSLRVTVEDFRLVSPSPQLKPFQPSPRDAACIGLGTHGDPARSRLHEDYVIGQDQDNRRPDNPPNQGREPPLVWSVEFTKKVHVASNDTAPLVFRLVARAMAPHSPSASSGKQKGERTGMPIRFPLPLLRAWREAGPTKLKNKKAGRSPSPS